MSEFKDCTFNGGNIRLDNNTYVNCKFTGCIIEFGAEGPIALDGCNFDKCEWVLVGYAKNTLGFLSSMYHGMGEFGQQMVEATFQNIKQPQIAPNNPIKQD